MYVCYESHISKQESQTGGGIPASFRAFVNKSTQIYSLVREPDAKNWLDYIYLSCWIKTCYWFHKIVIQCQKVLERWHYQKEGGQKKIIEPWNCTCLQWSHCQVWQDIWTWSKSIKSRISREIWQVNRQNQAFSFRSWTSTPASTKSPKNYWL